MAFNFIAIPRPKRKPLTREEKLMLEVDASTRKPGHEETYADIADLASQKHEQRLANQGKVGILQQAAIDKMAYEIKEKQKRRLLDQMKITKPPESE